MGTSPIAPGPYRRAYKFPVDQQCYRRTDCLHGRSPMSSPSPTQEMSDIMIKRATGQVACSECNRAKRKCDEKLPACTSCVLRNCADICPNGRSPHQTRKKKLATDSPVMAARIAQLEDALAIIQSSVSTEPHPLLKQELLQIKYGKPQQQCLDPSEPSRPALCELLGTLTINPNGESKYFGPSAGPESLLHFGREMLNSQPQEGDDTCNIDDQYLFLNQSSYTRWDNILQHFPQKPRAWALCETYIQHACLKEQFLERDELVNEFLVPIYNRLDPAQRLPSPQSNLTPHKLAVLLLVFAAAARVDMTLPPDSDEADMYFQLGRAALSLSPILNSTELATVQAILLLALSHTHGGRRYDIDAACMLAAIAVKIAANIGLHRESPGWNLDQKTLHRRRYVWWEAFSFDMCKSPLLPSQNFFSDPPCDSGPVLSFNLGRPPTIRYSYIDCKYPLDAESIVNENGDVQPGPDRWRWSFAKEVLAPTLENLAIANIPYSAIQEADRKMRDFPIPAKFKISTSGFTDEDDTTTIVYMKRHFPTHVVLLSTMHIHRTYFVQTMLNHASDPLGSPYATSFMASYKSASGLIGIYVKHMTRYPELLMRWWSIWSALLASAMVVGSIVIRSPNLSFTPKAYLELGIVVTLFERGAEQCPRARSGLVILRKLLARATHVFSHRHEAANSGTVTTDNNNEDVGDELAMFGGQTKVLMSTFLSQHRHRLLQSHDASPPRQNATPSHHSSQGTPHQPSEACPPHQPPQHAVPAHQSSQQAISAHLPSQAIPLHRHPQVMPPHHPSQTSTMPIAPPPQFVQATGGVGGRQPLQQWMQDLSDAQTTTLMSNSFSVEFMNSVMTPMGWDTLVATQHQNQHQANQRGVSQEWLTFMEQAGYLDAAP